MIRPEIQALLSRYAEVLLGIALVIFGVLALNKIGIFWQSLGVLLILCGGVMSWTAWRRVLMTSKDQNGPGVVEVDERQVTYFGAYEGGAISIDDLARVTILTNDQGPFGEDVHWVLEEDGGGQLVIPGSAEGAEQLFDALAPLKGFDYEAVIRAMGTSQNDSFVIWAKQRGQLH